MHLSSADVSLEFLTWFLWLGVFAVIQHQLCRDYPGIRTVCRSIFLVTMVAVLAPPIWVLCHPAGSRDLLGAVNRAFAAGVFAQITLRSLILMNWLAWPGLQEVLGRPTVLPSAVTELELLTSLQALTSAIQGVQKPPAGSED